jgi:hypothetical protein
MSVVICVKGCWSEIAVSWPVVIDPVLLRSTRMLVAKRPSHTQLYCSIAGPDEVEGSIS